MDALIVRSWQPSMQNERFSGALWFAALAGTIMAIGFIVVWWMIDVRAGEHIDSAVNDAIHMNQSMIRQDMENRLGALDRQAQRWMVSDPTPRLAWEADAARYVAGMPGFQAIERVDARLNVLWIVSPAGTEVTQDPGTGRNEQARIAIAKARESGMSTLTRPFELAGGGLGIAAYSPITHDGQFDGAIVGIVNLDWWLNSLIGPTQSTNYHFRVLLEGQEVFRRNANEAVNDAWTERRDFEFHGLIWTTLTTPTREFVAAVYAGSSTLILFIGIVLSSLVAVVVYLAVEARARARLLNDTAGRLATLFQNLPGMAYRCRNQLNRSMEFVSEGCRKLSGYSRGDFEEQRVFWGKLIHPDDVDRVRQEVQNAVASGKAFAFEYRIATRDEGEKWMWERGRAVRSGSDDGVRLEGFISDVTDRKHAETALSDARTFSEAVVDTAADAVITIDASGTIRTFNRAAQRMFDYSLEEVRGRNVSVLMPDPYDVGHDQYIAHYLETGEARIIGKGREVTAQRQDGSQFPVHLSVSEIRNRPQRMFVGLIHDLSRRRAAESEARQHRDQLAHMDRLNMLGEMATGIAHEINQPLTAISLFAQAGKRLFGKKNLERLPEIFDKLNQHALRASAVIERMQLMARRQESVKEVVDCHALVEDVVKLAESEARIRDMMIATSTEKKLPMVAVDTVQIQQVALNLLRNGMEAMRSVGCRDGNTIAVEATLRDDGHVEIAVIDKGCGVSEAVAGNLFKPFSTTKETGMGMGLSISRAIITAHGGNLDYRNNDSGGATFFFTLPPADEED